MKLDIRKEIEFWTQIMRDHGEFQFNSLVVTETEAINAAQHYMNLFEQLRLETLSNQSSLSNLITMSKTAVTQFINFKRYLLAGLMTCNIKIRMAPTFLNHMINEALEFLHVLNLADGTIQYSNIIENLRLHNIWLPDASGHASSVAAELDPVEAVFIKEAKEFSDKFDSLAKKAFSMYTMYERTRLNNSEIQNFNQQVVNTLSEFIRFLERVEDLRDECSLFSTGTFLPLLPNHMMREEGYYIHRIFEISQRFG